MNGENLYILLQCTVPVGFESILIFRPVKTKRFDVFEGCRVLHNTKRPKLGSKRSTWKRWPDLEMTALWIVAEAFVYSNELYKRDGLHRCCCSSSTNYNPTANFASNKVFNVSQNNSFSDWKFTSDCD